MWDTETGGVDMATGVWQLVANDNESLPVVMVLLYETAETAERGGVSRVMSCERETRLHGDELTAVALDDESSFTFSHFDNFYNNNTELG